MGREAALLALLACYLVGAIPIGYLFGRWAGIDVRRYGSGGTGATNVGRKLGLWWAVATAAGDLAKGLFAVWAGLRFGGPGSWLLAGCVVAAVAGHAWPVYIGFRGGKGVATGGGAMFWLFPLPTLVALLAGAAVVARTRYVSLGSLIAAAVLVAAVLLGPHPLPEKVMTVAAAAIVAWRHNANVRRLLSGTESRLGAPRT